MKARIMRTKTNNRSRTFILTLALNPLEANKLLDDCDTATEHNRATQQFFRIIEAIADENQAEIRLINSGAIDNAYGPDDQAGQEHPGDAVGPAAGSGRQASSRPGGSHSNHDKSL